MGRKSRSLSPVVSRRVSSFSFLLGQPLVDDGSACPPPALATRVGGVRAFVNNNINININIFFTQVLAQQQQQHRKRRLSLFSREEEEKPNGAEPRGSDRGRLGEESPDDRGDGGDREDREDRG